MSTTLNPPPNLADICQRFAITPERAKEIVSFLLEIGLVIEKASRYYPGPVITHLDKTSPEIANLHKNWRQKSMEMAERLSPDEFMYTCSCTLVHVHLQFHDQQKGLPQPSRRARTADPAAPQHRPKDRPGRCGPVES
jgi:hypothetical protein